MTAANLSTPARPGEPSTSLWSHTRYVIGENPLTAVAFLLFALFLLMAVAGPWLAPYDPLATNATAAMQPEAPTEGVTLSGLATTNAAVPARPPMT